MSFTNFRQEDNRLTAAMDFRNANKKGEWIKIIGGELPPEGKIKKMKDGNGMEQNLVRKGYRFCLPTIPLSTYISNTPTHWWKESE